MSIDLDEIKAGDEIVLQDKAGNVLTGRVIESREGLPAWPGDERWIMAFGGRIIFAKVSRANNWLFEDVPA